MHTLTLEFGDLEVNINKRYVFYKQKHISLPNQQYLLLVFLVENFEKIVSHKKILDEIFHGYCCSDAVGVGVAMLREKMSSKDLITTYRNTGYSINSAFLNATQVLYKLNGKILTN